MKRTILASILLLIAVVFYAQQRGANPAQPAAGGAAPAQRGGGRGANTLGDGPWTYTASGNARIRVSVVTKGLSHPWSMVWLPNGDMLITERSGQLRILRNGVLDPTPIPGVPKV
jgi:aldose sugar dehydrogenase